MIDKKYYDSNKREYKVGDIVYNPCFGDYWLVEEYTEEEQYETECLYCLSLYGDKDEYYIDIDEPAGFIIVCSKDEPDYNKYIEDFKEIIKRRREQEAQMEERWRVPIKSNKDLIEIAFEQIEKETGFHIINKEYNDDKYTEKEDQNTVCEFYIKEIPGFRFAFWNARRSKNKSDWFKEEHIEWLNGLGLDYLTELIFFTQYERDLDKFRLSRSGFVIGIHRNEYICEPNPDEEEIEPFNMFELTKALKYMKKHRIRSVEYAGCQTRYIWEDDRSSFRLLRQFIHDWIYEWKYRFKEWLKLKYAIFISKYYMKKLTQFNYIIKDHGKGCYPRIDVTVRRKDKIDINSYNKDWDILDKVDDKYFNLFNLQWLQYDIDENATEEIIQKDKSCRDNFFWYCYKNINESIHNLDSRIVAYSVETVEDMDEIIKRKDKEFEK